MSESEIALVIRACNGRGANGWCVCSRASIVHARFGEGREVARGRHAKNAEVGLRFAAETIGARDDGAKVQRQRS